jgi:hypothetical protein
MRCKLEVKVIGLITQSCLIRNTFGSIPTAASKELKKATDSSATILSQNKPDRNIRFL